MTADSEENCYIEISKEILYEAAHTELTVEALGFHELTEITFKRSAELMLELIQSIETTLNSGLIRPSYSLLRTALELCTSFSWLSLNFDQHIDRYRMGRCPSPKKMMSTANLNWIDEYEHTYRMLSDFVHGSFLLSNINKKESLYCRGEEIPDSLTSDLFISIEQSNPKLIYIDDKSSEELAREHTPYLGIKTFDIAVTMLMRASGPYSDSHSWWPGRSRIEDFSTLINDMNRNEYFLWPKEKKRLAINKVEGRYD